MTSTLKNLRQASIWAVAIEAPFAVLAALTALPLFYTAMPLVLTVHLPGILLLDSLGLCCGFGGGRVISDVGPSLEPPLILSVSILAVANIVVLVLVLWLAFIMAGGRRRAHLPKAAA